MLLALRVQFRPLSPAQIEAYLQRDKPYNCAGSFTYGSKAMQCWIKRQSGASHGSLELSDALMRSCNCFFYQYGNVAGVDTITRVGQMLGLGQRTSIGTTLGRPEVAVLPGLDDPDDPARVLRDARRQLTAELAERVAVDDHYGDPLVLAPAPGRGGG